MNKAMTLGLIKERQWQWAMSRGIAFAPNGRVTNFNDNLFAPLNSESMREISEGDGGELGTSEKVGKLYSLWSSSALACNVFDYWRERDLAPLLGALSIQGKGYEQPGFEQKFPTGVRSARANMDVVFRVCDSMSTPVAIESKFTEPYQSNEKECLRQSYFQKSHTWDGLPACRNLADNLSICKRFQCLDAGQLLKHILGLTRAFGQRRFLLLYLWYEVEGSNASDLHRTEVIEFSRLISTEVQFRSVTYQQLFGQLAPSIADTPYESYVRFRYFEISENTNCEHQALRYRPLDS